MAGGRQTPRQKMINLMYLVFIAMMAINIDREVLRSFEGVNQSLLTLSDQTYQTNLIFLDNIKQKSEKGDIGFTALLPQAQQVSEMSDNTYGMIKALKDLITKDKYKERNNDTDINYNSLQNTDASNKILFASDKKVKPEFQKVLDQVINFKLFMLKNTKATDTTSIKRINSLFKFSDKGEKSWAVDKFYGQPMIAVLTNLTTLQANVRAEEGNMLNRMLATKLQQQIDLREFEPVVLAPTYIPAGESFDVTVAFGAYDNTLKGNITLNGRDVPFSGGKGTVRMTASGSGVQHLKGAIAFEDSQGNTTTRDFDKTYEVVNSVTRDAGVGVVVADKMNVVYRGVDNPMNAVVAGVDAKTVTLNAASGTLSRSGTGKGWNYRPGQGSEVVFTVSGKTSSGKSMSMSYPFRIKNVPKAQGQIRDKNNVSIPASSLVNQVVTAAIPDFEFPVSFTVTGFKVKVPGIATAVVSGNSLSAASGVLSRARAGDQVLIFDISATAVGTNQSNISPVVINVQ